MAVDLALAKAHLNLTDDGDDQLVTALIAAAKAHIARLLGFALDDEDQFPAGTPADLDEAQLLLIGHWYENREQTITGTIIAPIPFGVAEIVAEYRSYSFGVSE